MTLLKSIGYSLTSGREHVFIENLDNTPLSYPQKQAVKIITTAAITLCKGLCLVAGGFAGGVGGLAAGSIAAGPWGIVGLVVGALIGGGVGFKLGHYAGILLGALSSLAMLGWDKVGKGTIKWLERCKRAISKWVERCKHAISRRFSSTPTVRKVVVPLHTAPPHTMDLTDDVPKPEPSAIPAPTAPLREKHHGYLYRLMTEGMPSFTQNRRCDEERSSLLSDKKRRKCGKNS